MNRIVVLATVAIVTTGCGGGGGTAGPETPIVRISIEPDAVLLPAIPAMMRLAVTATLADSSSVDITDSRQTTYRSTDPSVAAAGAGAVFAAGEGESFVIVENRGTVDSVRVTVSEASPIPLASFDVGPLSLALGVGEERALTGTAIWTNGARLSLAGLPFRYETGDARIATVSPNGLVAGKSSGQTSISVSYRDAVIEVPVRVTAPRATVSFEREVLPVLQGECAFAGCHSGLGTPQRGLRLNSYANLQAGGDNGPVVTAGAGASSRLILALRGTLDGVRRQPLGRAALSETTLGTIETWIDEGGLDN